MQSGFTGGDVPDVYSTSRAIGTAMANHHPSSQQNPYRSLLPGGSNFIGPTSQMSRQIPPTSSTVIGKRSLADFRTQYQHNQALSNLLLRSVKPRTYNHQPSPVSHLSHIDFSSTMSFPISSELQSHRLLQQLRPHPMSTPMTNSGLPGLPYSGPVQTRSVSAHESETKMMNHRLQELEKQLLDDNDEDDAADEVSVITNTNSEWSETIQNLISPTQCQSQSQKSISPSPTSSTLSSSSSSSSVGSQASLCWKQSVMEAASVIYEGKSEQATEILMRVSCQIPNVKVHSEQRLMEFMISALKSRLNAMENPPPVAELYDLEHTASTQLLYEVSPCFKLSFLAANLAILEAVAVQGEESNCSKFHVLDFDIGEGGQYLNLLHMLSTQRQSGTKPPAAVFKLTTMAENGGEERLKKVSEMLSQHAELVGVSFKLNVISSMQVSDLNRNSLGCEPEEPLAVNFAFKLYRMPDESVSTENPRDELLRRVKGLSPRVVTVVEQEMNTNTAPFPTRVTETSSYYGALFDSIESTVGRDNSDRVKVEEGLGRKLVNSIACEGRDRVERCEVFGKWRSRLGMAGFELKPLSQNVAESMRNRLSTGSRVNPGFTVKEENGGVCFGWLGRTLTVASAWR